MKLFQELGLDYDMLEEDQMMRAIAMSLGQDMPLAAAPAVDQVQIQYNLYTAPSLWRAFSIFSHPEGKGVCRRLVRGKISKLTKSEQKGDYCFWPSSSNK